MQDNDYARACKTIGWRAALEELHALDSTLECNAWPSSLPSPGDRDELAFRVFVQSLQAES